MFKPLWNPRGMSFDFTVGDWKPCEGVQKIAGFSRGWHHWNSIRLGYNRDTETSPVRLFMYAYVAGKLINPKECVICTIEVGMKASAELEWTNQVGILIRSKDLPDYGTGIYHRGIYINHKTLPIGYKLGPYAKQDRTQKRLDFNVELTNVKYW